MDETEHLIDPALKTWATEAQARYVDAVNEHGGYRNAGRELGVNHSTIVRVVHALERRAALQGYAPANDMRHTAPSPFVVKGTSTLYDKDGLVKIQWVKTKLDSDLQEAAIRAFVDSLVEDARGLAPPTPSPAVTLADLLVVYPMGDPHFGMYAWKDEAGEDFDLEVAERLTCAAIDRLVESAPAAETALIVNLGDFFHADNSSNQTARSSNALDVDTRWAKVLQVGLRAMVHVIRKALEKHANVIVRNVAGNHDTHSSFALALALDAYFSAEPRVRIDLSPAAFWFLRFGKVLIGATHGDTAKMADLPGVMACDRPEDWGATRYRYWYAGHIHHEKVQEYPGVTVEYFRTLAAKDAWHAAQGYRSGRDMRCVIHHREFGEIERHRCDIAMIERTAA